MKNLSLLTIVFFVLSQMVMAQSSPDTLWTKALGGTSTDYAYSIHQTYDSGYVIAGYSGSTDGDVHGNHGSTDFWVTRIRSSSDTIWTKSFGGSTEEEANSIQQTFDSGYVVTGFTESNDGYVHGNHGNRDFWVVKLNSTGDTIWTKCLGGTVDDIAYSIQQTFDSGYIVAGHTHSTDGDVHGNHGSDDFWVVKLNNNGDTLWTRCYGGSGIDRAYSIQQTFDSGYIVAGRTSSNDGDVHGNHGTPDYWVVRLDNFGDTLWTRCLGGTYYDIAYSIQQTFDMGYIIAGETSSNDGDVYGNHGDRDYWVVKLDSVGGKLWTKCLGGLYRDEAYSIQQTSDSGYIVTGYSNSIDGDVEENHGGGDYWVVKLNKYRHVVWTKCLGGSDYEYAHSIQQNYDNSYVLTGVSGSSDYDVHDSHGNYDFWVVHLAADESICQKPTGQTVTNFTSNSVDLSWTENGSATIWQIMLDTAGFDTATATPVTVPVNFYTWTGLNENTIYEWYVRSDCGDGEHSIWTGPQPIIFPVTNFPWTEGFEHGGNIPLGWSNEHDPGVDDWIYIDGDGGVGPIENAHSGAYNGFRDPDDGFPVKLITPPLDLTNLTNPVLSFWNTQAWYPIWHGIVDQCHLALFYKTSYEGEWTQISIQDYRNCPNDWIEEYCIPLSNPSAQYYIAFEASVGSMDGPGICLDDVLVEDMPSCLRPAEMKEYIGRNQVDLSWTEMGTATSWQIMAGIAGFDTATASKVMVSDTCYVLNNLTENTVYEWYVRADCGGGDYSRWTVPRTFEFRSPPVLFSKTYGGSNAYDMQQTRDSGFIIAGYGYSENGDGDYWIIKLNNNGDTVWTRCFGGSSYDKAYAVQPTVDSGYIVAGVSTSNDGDVQGNHGAGDFWIIKLNSVGDTLWTKCMGGSDSDVAYSIIQTYDSCYIIAGRTSSKNGDVSGNNGSSDFWVVKLTGEGDTLWTKCLGGSFNEYAYEVQQTCDSDYIVAGYTNSNDKYVHGNNGGYDFWVVKLNNEGDTVWTKTLGGSLDDYARAVCQTADSNFVVTGYSNSDDGYVHGNHGYSDYWVVKLNNDGDTLWTNCLGGSSYEEAYSIRQTNDIGCIVTGETKSNDGDVHGNHSSYMSDYWVVKLDALGDTLWTISLGGTEDDEAHSILRTYDQTYLIAGYTDSNDGDVFGNHGRLGLWIVELSKFPNHIYQDIQLSSGWNILSFNVTPNDLNLQNILQPLIDSSELEKVIDEAGNIIQDIPGIGWMNTIGNMANTEGYYTKVNDNTQLRLTGLPVALPYTIPLTTGWNIMGYPLQQSQDALSAVQPLIDDDELIKVMDESGGFIQDIPGIGWMNTIGDFEAGEGYYIKVTDNTSLTLDNPPVLFIGSPPIVQKRPQLFNVPKANPYLPMNIIVTGINIEGYTIQTDDEIAVFDNNRLVGAGVINPENKALTTFAAAMDDPTTTAIDGYIEGNLPAFQFKSANLNGSIRLTAKPIFGSPTFSPLGTLVCTLVGSLVEIEEEPEKTFALKCIPNPANNLTNIQYQLPEEGQLQLEVFDLSSHRIAVLQSEHQSPGSYNYRFDAALLERGIYLIKVQLRTKDNQYTEVVKFVRN